MPPESSDGERSCKTLQADGFQRAGDNGVNFRRRFELMLGQIEADVLPNGQGGQQSRRLEDHGRAVLGMHGGVARRLALDEDFPRIGRQQANDESEQDAFAAAARPHDDEALARANLEGDAS
jgi:hypothetical protein